MRLARVATTRGTSLGLDVNGTLIDLGRYLEATGRSALLESAAAAVEKDEAALAVALARSAFDGVMKDLWTLPAAELGTYAICDIVRFLSPVRRPSKILAAGRNYLAHALESGYYTPQEVLFFCKAPSCLTGHGQPVRIPAWAGRIDPEGELAVVIGAPGRYIAEESAMAHVAGYSIINDVSARSMQESDLERRDPWFRSKSIDTFAPMGPFLVTSDDVPDPHKMDLETRVNGEVRQKSNTDRLIFKVPKIIAQVSRFMTLETGDVIATGTPEGMRPIAPGDRVEVTIGDLGTLSNPVVSE